jgi:hypothetical protein
MAKHGMNMVVIDLGDGVEYQSHPEIAVKGAWSRLRLRDELKKMRSMGLEPIPKLNFSTCHDEWLGDYSKMVCSPKYYEVCKDLIAEVIELFERPRLFHLGMDEEDAKHQKAFEYVVVRQYGLWWRDFEFFVDQVTSKGIQPWIWADYVWEHPELFYARMPKSILQSNWYYGTNFDGKVLAVKTYNDLEAHGYDQVPTLSNWTNSDNIEGTVRYCKEHIDPQRLKGFLLAPWRPTLAETRDRHLDAIEHFAKAMEIIKT